MKKIAILANPAAGKSRALKHAFHARAELWGRSCEYIFPSSIAELQGLYHQFSSESYEAVILIGGDGTLNQFIRKHFNSLSADRKTRGIPILIFPGGTANDLAKELGIHPDWNQIQTLLDHKKYSLMDLIEVNGIPFATVGGVGLGSVLTSEFNSKRYHSLMFKGLSRLLQSQIYSLLSAKMVLLGSDYIHHLQIKTTGFDEKLKTPAIFLCNQSHLGGGLRVAPDNDNSDRRFNVLIVPSYSRIKLLKALLQLKSGILPSDFLVFSTDDLTIQSLDSEELKVFGDGEYLTQSRQLHFRVQAQALPIYRAQARAQERIYSGVV